MGDNPYKCLLDRLRDLSTSRLHLVAGMSMDQTYPLPEELTSVYLIEIQMQREIATSASSCVFRYPHFVLYALLRQGPGSMRGSAWEVSAGAESTRQLPSATEVEDAVSIPPSRYLRKRICCGHRRFRGYIIDCKRW